MIPNEIYSLVSAGSSNDELRDIGRAHGIDYSELWAARDRKKKFFNRGVSRQMKRDRYR